MDHPDKKLKVLGIGLDYQSIVAAQTRGDFYARFVEIAKDLNRLVRIIYCPAKEALAPISVGDTAEVIFTNSKRKWSFTPDALHTADRLMQQESFDLLTAEDPLLAGLTGWLLKRRYGIPLNVQIFDSRINNPYWLKEHPRNHVLNALANFVVRRADSVRVVAKCTKRALIQAGVAADRIGVVPTIMDVKKFTDVDGSALRKQYLGTGFNRLILFAGRLSKEKNLPMLIRAFHRIHTRCPQALLMIVGEGPLQQPLQTLCRELGLSHRVVFTGPVHYDLIPQYHAAADIFVLPSFHEGRANVLVEAALSRTAIIATDVGDARDYILNGKTGYVIPVDDIAALAERIARIIFDNQSPELSQRAFDHVQAIMKETNQTHRLIQHWRETIRSRRHSN